MKINIQQVKDNIGATQNFRLCFSAADLFEESEHTWINDPIVAAGEIVNDGLLLKVGGVIELTANFECDRCLEKYTKCTKIAFLEEFRETSERNGSDEINTYHGDEINIGELLRESIILATPLKTVCNEDCQGLCPKCGTNLNISTCACEKGVIDPRLAALQQLLDKK
ncbi:hypothetical protein SDC9_172719 [bioreactor metagenome]|uniref:Large ribosomal RNA subunit accumulation protein YceD n=1 Tax=bioreactor metagenome TaxID=1076179 RepID=A0A645GEG8_9ZZZZ